MRRLVKYVSIFIITCLFESASADPNNRELNPKKLEAVAPCLECVSPTQTLQLKEHAEKIEASLKNKKSICDQKGIIDTKRQALINKLLPNNSDISVEEYTFRQTVSCIYGLGEGGVQSVVSLVKGVADLVGGAYRGGKSVAKFFAENKAGDILEGIDLTQLPDQLKKTTGQVLNSITSSISRMAESVKTAYQELGAKGALSLMAYEIWQKSPHHILKNFLKKTVDKMGNFLSRESSRFNCLDNESKAELMCKLIGTIGTDVLIGSSIAKVILWGKSAYTARKVKTAEEGLNTAKGTTTVEQQLASSAEAALKPLTSVEASELLSAYNLPSSALKAGSKILPKLNSEEKQSMLKLFEKTQSAKPEIKKQVADLVDSLSEISTEQLEKLDIAKILNEATHAATTGNKKVLADWNKIAKNDLNGKNSKCYMKASTVQ